MKASSNQIRQALDKPSPDIRLYLLHGPDEATAADLATRGHGAKVTLVGHVAALKETATKSGNRMAFLTLEDMTGTVEVTGLMLARPLEELGGEGLNAPDAVAERAEPLRLTVR